MGNDQTEYNNIRKRVMTKDYTHATLNNVRREDQGITMVVGLLYARPMIIIKETSVLVRVTGSRGGRF